MPKSKNVYLTPSAPERLGCPTTSWRHWIKKWHKTKCSQNFILQFYYLCKNANSANLYLAPPMDQPMGGGGQHLWEILDPKIYKDKKFLESYFRQDLFYAKIPKSKIFKDPQFQGSPRSPGWPRIKKLHNIKCSQNLIVGGVYFM